MLRAPFPRSRGTFREKADFTADDMILAKLKK